MAGPSPVNSEEQYCDQNVVLHDKILDGLLSIMRLPLSPDGGPSLAHAYQSIADMAHVNMGQLFFMKHQGMIKYQSVLVAEKLIYNREGCS